MSLASGGEEKASVLVVLLPPKSLLGLQLALEVRRLDRARVRRAHRRELAPQIIALALKAERRQTVVRSVEHEVLGVPAAGVHARACIGVGAAVAPKAPAQSVPSCTRASVRVRAMGELGFGGSGEGDGGRISRGLAGACQGWDCLKLSDDVVAGADLLQLILQLPHHPAPACVRAACVDACARL